MTTTSSTTTTATTTTATTTTAATCLSCPPCLEPTFHCPEPPTCPKLTCPQQQICTTPLPCPDLTCPEQQTCSPPLPCPNITCPEQLSCPKLPTCPPPTRPPKQKPCPSPTPCPPLNCPPLPPIPTPTPTSCPPQVVMPDVVSFHHPDDCSDFICNVTANYQDGCLTYSHSDDAANDTCKLYCHLNGCRQELKNILLFIFYLFLS